MISPTCADPPAPTATLTVTSCGSMGKNGTLLVLILSGLLFTLLLLVNKVIIVTLILSCYFSQPVLFSSALDNKLVYEHRPKMDVGHLEGVSIQ